jgi:hypothetical protein
MSASRTGGERGHAFHPTVLREYDIRTSIGRPILSAAVDVKTRKTA